MGSRRAGFSSCSSVHGLSSCGALAQLFHSMWDLPGPGLEPVSPALTGRFLTTVPPRKPCVHVFTSTVFNLSFEKKKNFTDLYNANLAAIILVFSLFLFIFLWQWQNVVPIIQCTYMYVMRALVCNQSLISVAAVLFSPTAMPSLLHLDSPPYTNLSGHVEALLTLTRALTPAPGHPIHIPLLLWLWCPSIGHISSLPPSLAVLVLSCSRWGTVLKCPPEP